MIFYAWGALEARAFVAGILLGLSLSLWVYLSTHRNDDDEPGNGTPADGGPS